MDSFAPPLTCQCCLCGSTQALSGEHKIKASALRSIFGDRKTVIVREGGRSRHAQSSKSKAYHYEARVCEPCNSARTRPADLAFDSFNAAASELFHRGSDPANVFDDPRFDAESGELYLDVFRYFAKLMCCHLAEMSAPYLQGLADFAIGSSNHNVIYLGVGVDVAYQRLQSEAVSTAYAAHGGLVVLADKTTRELTSFYSTLTIGPVRYCYYVRYNELGLQVLMNDYPEFYAWCSRRIAEAIITPLSANDRELLGLTAEPQSENLPP